jgi:hypothetical protein
MGPPASLDEALRAGKKFSRCIRQDAVGTCPQIVDERTRGATNFVVKRTLNHPRNGRVGSPLHAERDFTKNGARSDGTHGVTRPTFALGYLPEGEGLGGSLPDSIIVGRIGPMSIASDFVVRSLARRGVLLCSTGISLLTGLGVSATLGIGAGALSTRGFRVLVGSETDSSFDPPAARSPAARISSSVNLAGADFFSRGLDFRGVGAGDSEGSCSESSVVCSEGFGVCLGGSGVCLLGWGFFSRATITSCACIFPMKTAPHNSVAKNFLSMMPPDKRMNPFTRPRS